MSIQEALKALGYDPGISDGKCGPQTVEQMDRLMLDNGYPMPGKITTMFKVLLAELSAQHEITLVPFRWSQP